MSADAQTPTDQLRQRFKTLTETELPALAKLRHWPLRLDHCFKRVCLDWACNDCWYAHIRRPAERHLEGETLMRAVRCAEDLLAGDLALLGERNAQSLHWRGKRAPPARPASDIERSRER